MTEDTPFINEDDYIWYQDEPATERDREVAKQLKSVPDHLSDELESGIWSDDLYFAEVRGAEACIDYLNAIYGLEFSAVDSERYIMLHDGHIESSDFVLRVESGPYAGELVNIRYVSGWDVPDKRQQSPTSFLEDCYYVVNHEEWESTADDAVERILSDFPAQSWFCVSGMSRLRYVARQVGKHITAGGGRGRVDVYVDMVKCEFSTDDMDDLLLELCFALHSTGLRGTVCLHGFKSAGASDAIAVTTLPFYSDHVFRKSHVFGV